MNREALLNAARLALAAADSATIAASFDRIRPERAEHFARLSEDALNAALEALAEARLGRTTFLAVAAEITQPMERAA